LGIGSVTIHRSRYRLRGGFGEQEREQLSCEGYSLVAPALEKMARHMPGHLFFIS
jgi:hypothetical protein